MMAIGHLTSWMGVCTQVCGWVCGCAFANMRGYVFVWNVCLISQANLSHELASLTLVGPPSPPIWFQNHNAPHFWGGRVVLHLLCAWVGRWSCQCPLCGSHSRDKSQSVWFESMFGVLVVSQQSLNLSDCELASLLPSITEGPTLLAVYWAYITMLQTPRHHIRSHILNSKYLEGAQHAWRILINITNINT